MTPMTGILGRDTRSLGLAFNEAAASQFIKKSNVYRCLARKG